MFSFRLEKILEYRVGLEKNAEQMLAAAKNEQKRCSEALSECLHRLDVSFHTVRENKQDLAAGIHQDCYREALTAEIKKKVELLKRAGEKVDICCRDLATARRERILLEKLKEKLYREYLLLNGRREQSLCDEIASVLFSRRLSEI